MTEWFTNHISRRSLGKGLAWGAVLAMAGVTVYQLASSGDKEVDSDSFALQKKEGWNVGSTDKFLSFERASLTDSRGNFDRLRSELSDLGLSAARFAMAAVLRADSDSIARAAVAQRSDAPGLQPQMRETYDRAEALRNLVSQTPNPCQTLVISDLPGPESVALGAAMADTAQLVPVFDNWPHPLGVVRSHETLGAMDYYAKEIEKRSKLKENAPTICCSTATAWPLTPTRTRNWTTAIREAAARRPAQTARRPAGELSGQGRESKKRNSTTSTKTWSSGRSRASTCGCCGSRSSNPSTNRLKRPWRDDRDDRDDDDQCSTPLLLRRSPLGVLVVLQPLRIRLSARSLRLSRRAQLPIPRPTTGQTYNPPTYRPASRPTVFSNSRVRWRFGVGRARPSGFGRTSVRMSSDGRVTGTRSGRTGSYGRSGGGWFGG